MMFMVDLSRLRRGPPMAIVPLVAPMAPNNFHRSGIQYDIFQKSSVLPLTSWLCFFFNGMHTLPWVMLFFFSVLPLTSWRCLFLFFWSMSFFLFVVNVVVFWSMSFFVCGQHSFFLVNVVFFVVNVVFFWPMSFVFVVNVVFFLVNVVLFLWSM